MNKTYKILYTVEMEVNGVEINEEVEETATMSDELFDNLMAMADDVEGINIISCEEVDAGTLSEVKASPLAVIMRLFGK